MKLSDERKGFLREKLSRARLNEDHQLVITTEDLYTVLEHIEAQRRQLEHMRTGIRTAARNLNAMAKE